MTRRITPLATMSSMIVNPSSDRGARRGRLASHARAERMPADRHHHPEGLDNRPQSFQSVTTPSDPGIPPGHSDHRPFDLHRTGPIGSAPELGPQPGLDRLYAAGPQGGHLLVGEGAVEGAEAQPVGQAPAPLAHLVP